MRTWWQKVWQLPQTFIIAVYLVMAVALFTMDTVYDPQANAPPTDAVASLAPITITDDGLVGQQVHRYVTTTTAILTPTGMVLTFEQLIRGPDAYVPSSIGLAGLAVFLMLALAIASTVDNYVLSKSSDNFPRNRDERRWQFRLSGYFPFGRRLARVYDLTRRRAAAPASTWSALITSTFATITSRSHPQSRAPSSTTVWLCNVANVTRIGIIAHSAKRMLVTFAAILLAEVVWGINHGAYYTKSLGRYVLTVCDLPGRGSTNDWHRATDERVLGTARNREAATSLPLSPTGRRKNYLLLDLTVTRLRRLEPAYYDLFGLRPTVDFAYTHAT